MLLAWQSVASHAWAVQDAEVRIKRVTPRVSQARLAVTIEIENLFSEKIIGTIRSGLPSVVFVDIELAEKGGRRIARQRIVQSISYDIWQERYTIERDTLRRTLANFDSMQQASSTLHDIEMSALAQLKGQLSYVLTVQAGISPISGRQSQKFSSWLQDSDEIRSDVGSLERAAGFQLNLSKLVSFLIGGDKRRGNTSPERRIEFRISELK